MAEQDGGSTGSDVQFVPALIQVEQEAQVWKDVLDFKAHQQRSAQDRDTCDGSGGKHSGSWEIVDCSHASECGSTARTLPGSEFGLSEHASAAADMTQEFQEVHLRAVAEIEAFEAAERETTLGKRGPAPLPVSTDARGASNSDFQFLTDASGDSPKAHSDSPEDAAAVGEGLEVTVLSEGLEPGVELVCGVEDLGGYASTEEVRGLEPERPRSEPDSHGAMVELQEISQEGSLDGNYWPECESAKGGLKVEGEVDEMPLPGAESFEDVKSAEGAFSELSFDSPKVSREVSHQGLSGARSLSMGSIKPETQPEALGMGQAPTMVALKEGADGENLELDKIGPTPKAQQFLQNCSSIFVDLLPKFAVPRFLSAMNFVSHMDWKGFACTASLAMLSSMVVGLMVENRRLSCEIRKKHEEVSRLMKALMNFQELWSTHRAGKVPILRHTNFTRTMRHVMPR